MLDRDPEESLRLNAAAQSAISLEDKFDAFFSMRAIETEAPFTPDSGEGSPA
jgi:hypothetical protein